MDSTAHRTLMPASSTGPAPAEAATTRPAAGDRRDSVRYPCGGPIWWKRAEDGQFRQGWLIERSTDGTAFLIRGNDAPFDGVKLAISTSDPTDIGFRVEEGLVRRSSHVHADLYLVAVQVQTGS